MTHDDHRKERLFSVDLHRAGDPYKTRHCSSLDNAVISATKLAQEHGMLRDVVEVSHKITGKQLATVKVTLKGLDIKRVWEREI